MERVCSACGGISETEAALCPICNERFVTSTEAAMAGRGAVHPYLISSFVVSGCAVLFGGILALVAMGLALAARSKGEARWLQGVVVALAALVVGVFLALAFRGFIQ